MLVGHTRTTGGGQTGRVGSHIGRCGEQESEVPRGPGRGKSCVPLEAHVETSSTPFWKRR